VKEGALYSVKALYPKNTFEGQFAYRSTLESWMKWLLLLVWRDAEEGDLVLGSDKAKGYGQLVLRAFKQGAQHYFTAHQTELKHGANELMRQLNLTTEAGA
jgi:CRISPR/Cas system CSM-associated protein Csm3 (group 7 of RAMP superfamily)